MPNYTNDPAFMALVHGVDLIIHELAQRGVPDAQAITDRYAGDNNLQGHANGLVPVALWFSRANQDLLKDIRASTDLGHNMGRGSPEAGDRTLWMPIQRAFRGAVNTHGRDVVTRGGRAHTPHRVEDIVDTYLPTAWGGSQSTGGAGGTVIKRVLKILAHTLIV